MDGDRICVSNELRQRTDDVSVRNKLAKNIFYLRGLDEQAMYEVSKDGQFMMLAPGSKLAKDGLQVKLRNEWRSAVFQIKKLKQKGRTRRRHRAEAEARALQKSLRSCPSPARTSGISPKPARLNVLGTAIIPTAVK